jgi:1-acyl-sn-glycerol-3-phosphate acyltransferase
LLYHLLKFFASLAIRIFCRRIIINRRASLAEKGPLLLACNHPNSFLDSVIIDILFREPVWSLARGDVFKKPLYIRLLHSLKILPVYRTSEGVENLSENYKTFDACIGIFRKNGIVAIFSEGKCINEWHLRPLKKGTARLAFKAWEENIPLRVLPIGINYSSFRKFGKNVFLNFGDIIERDDIPVDQTDGQNHQAFNKILEEKLSNLVFEIEKNDTIRKKKILERPALFIEKIILTLPAVAGWLVHAPLYLPIRSFTYKRTWENDHYDSVMTALLFVLYPVYLLVITLILFIITKQPLYIGILLIFPLMAWAYVRLKKQID